MLADPSDVRGLADANASLDLANLPRGSLDPCPYNPTHPPLCKEPNIIGVKNRIVGRPPYPAFSRLLSNEKSIQCG